MKPERKSVFTCCYLPDKEKRNLTIFELIRKKGLISKPEISKLTGINIVSVSNYIENYIAKKLVTEKLSEVSSGGRKPDLVEINRKERFVIGIEAGERALHLAACDLGGRPIAKVTVAAPATDAAAVAGTLEVAFGDLLKKAAVEKDAVEAVGIGIADERLLEASETLGKRLGLGCFAGCAAQCAAFGERAFNDAVEVDDILYMHSDLGSGVAIKGAACYGALEADEKLPSPLEWHGFVEDLAYLRPWHAALGVVAAARAEVERGIGTKIVDAAEGDVARISVETVIDAARKSDRVALDILRNAGINLGVRTAYLINVFGPRTVIIGGGIEAAGDIVLGPLESMVKRFSFAKRAARVKIVPGALGPDAVSLGAANLAVREVFLRA